MRVTAVNSSKNLRVARPCLLSKKAIFVEPNFTHGIVLQGVYNNEVSEFPNFCRFSLSFLVKNHDRHILEHKRTRAVRSWVSMCYPQNIWRLGERWPSTAPLYHNPETNPSHIETYARYVKMPTSSASFATSFMISDKSSYVNRFRDSDQIFVILEVQIKAGFWSNNRLESLKKL